MKFVSCMGGWCGLREHCQFYRVSGQNLQLIRERRCLPGNDGTYLSDGEYRIAPVAFVHRRELEASHA
jgi:hypothetical protein